MMYKIIAFVCMVSLLGISLCLAQTEELTITTYYPSPHGVYDELLTSRFSVGDINGDGNLTDADLPPAANDGEVWINGNVGIGTPVVRNDVRLHIHTKAGSPGRQWITSDSFGSSLFLGTNYPAAPHWGFINFDGSDDVLRIGTGGAGAARADIIVDYSGNIGIGDIDIDGFFEINPDRQEDSGDEFVIRGNTPVTPPPVPVGIRVGIGTTTPRCELDVPYRIMTGRYFIEETNYDIAVPWNAAAWIDHNNGNLYMCRFAGPAGDQGIHFVNPFGQPARMTIMENGRVGIGITNPEEKLDIDGIVRVQGWDAVYKSLDTGAGVNKQFHLIGTYHGWDTEAIYIAGYNFYSPEAGNPDYSYAKKIHFGHPERMTVDLNTGNVGIGTTSPSQKLHVNGNIQFGAESSSSILGDNWAYTMLSDRDQKWRIFLTRAANGGHIYYDLANAADARHFFRAPDEVLLMQICRDGKVRIGTDTVTDGYTDPTYVLEVDGDAGKTVGGTAWVSISDDRFKNILGNINNALEVLKQLTPVKYTWNDLYKGKFGKNNETNNEILYGFTAQDVRKVIPEMINEDENGYLWYNPSGFEAILTKAIQEQQVLLEKLQVENESLKKRIEALENLQL